MTILVSSKCCKEKRLQRSATLKCIIASMLREDFRYDTSLCTKATENRMGLRESLRSFMISQEQPRRQLLSDTLACMKNEKRVSLISNFRHATSFKMALFHPSASFISFFILFIDSFPWPPRDSRFSVVTRIAAPIFFNKKYAYTLIDTSSVLALPLSRNNSLSFF